jgi:hypothetical protein
MDMDEEFFEASLRAIQRAADRASRGTAEDPRADCWKAILDFVGWARRQEGQNCDACLVIEMGLIGPRSGELEAKVVPDLARVPWRSCPDAKLLSGYARALFDQLEALGGHPIPTHESACNSGVGFYLTASDALLLGRMGGAAESTPDPKGS